MIRGAFLGRVMLLFILAIVAVSAVCSCVWLKD